MDSKDESEEPMVTQFQDLPHVLVADSVMRLVNGEEIAEFQF